jgi:hypothetical protein
MDQSNEKSPYRLLVTTIVTTLISNLDNKIVLDITELGFDSRTMANTAYYNINNKSKSDNPKFLLYREVVKLYE